VDDQGPPVLVANCPFAELDASETAVSFGWAVVRPT
jgi:hypothetical protein